MAGIVEYEIPELNISAGRKVSATEGIGAGFDYAEPEAGFFPARELQLEVMKDAHDAVSSVWKEHSSKFSEELAMELINQDFKPDPITLGRFRDELQANGLELPVSLREEELERRRAGAVAEVQSERAAAQDILQRSGAPTAYGLIGGVGAEFTDPANLATFGIGASARAGLLATVAIEAGVNALIEAAQTPARNAFLASIGDKEGNIAENMLVGAVFGAAMGGAVKAAPKLGKAGFAGLSRLGRLVPTGARRAVSEELASSADPLERGVASQVLRDVEDEEAAVTNPSTEAAREHTVRQEAGARILEGQDASIPDRPSTAVPRASIINGEIEEISPRDLVVQPKTFQFKSEADAEGVTDKLRDVQEWKSERAGVVLVYEYADGTRAIADGHQRTAFANRIMDADPSQDIRMAARVFREADGFTTDQVRIIAALKNISEAADGMTASMARDAAKVLRVEPAAISQLPAGPGIGRAQALAKLSDDAFQLVINDVIPDRFAELIGRKVDDASLHLAMVRLLERVGPQTAEQASSIIDQALLAPVEKRTEVDLFGATDVTESLFLERAKVLERAKALIRDDRKTFAVLTDRGSKIEGAGNKLNRASNEDIRKRLEEALVAVERLAHRAGPISEALNNGAKAYKGDGRLKDAADAVVSAIRAELGRNGLAGAGARAGERGAEPERAREQAPDPHQGFDDPVAGPGIEAQIAATRIEEVAPGERAMLNATALLEGKRGVVVADDMETAETLTVWGQLKSRQPFETLEDAIAIGAAHHAKLNDAVAEVADRLGLTFKPAPLKTIERAREKVDTKYRGNVKEAADIARAGVTIRSTDDAERLIDHLSWQFGVLDEGLKRTPQGYFDHKLAIVFEDGFVGELQMWPPGMFEAKHDGGGHDAYKMARDPNSSPDQREVAEEFMRELYAGVAAELDPSFAKKLGSGAGASEASTSSARSSSRTAAASSGEPSSGSQVSPTRSAASDKSSDMTARFDPSNTNTFMGDTSGSDINAGSPGGKPGAGNSEATPAGEQQLIPGVAPVTDRQRAEAQMAKPKDGGPRRPDSQAGPLFDPMDASRADLFDRVAIGRAVNDEGDEVVQTMTRAEIAAELDADDEFVEGLGICLK